MKSMKKSGKIENVLFLLNFNRKFVLKSISDKAMICSNNVLKYFTNIYVISRFSQVPNWPKMTKMDNLDHFDPP